jgi:hypothetical protein
MMPIASPKEAAGVLRSFRVTNHRSIRTEQELVLTPVYDKTRPVVPVAAIFGANASGKTNLLDALRFMQHAVRDSYGGWDPRTRVPRSPFLLDPLLVDPATAAEPSVYVAELLLDGVRHIYGFEVDDQRVREEWLYAYPHNRRQVIFDREGQRIRTGSTSGPPRRLVAVLERLLPDTALFLTLAGRSTVEEVAAAYRWFADKLEFIVEEARRPDEQQIAHDLSNPEVGEPMIALLRAADMGIDRITVETALDGSHRLLFHHTGGGPPLRFRDEAHGTKVWLSYLRQLLGCLTTGSVLVIDEVGANLHPRLTTRLVEMFKSPVSNPHSAQLVFTSHDATQLGRDLGEDILARDAVWFVKKDRAGSTTLYPLSAFKPRKEENTERRYLSGSYGAVGQLFDVEFEDAAMLHQDLVGGRAAS